MSSQETQKTLGKFSQHFKSVLKSAESLASQFGHKKIEASHLFYGIANERGSVAGETLLALKLNPERIKTIIQTSYPGKITDFLQPVDFSDNSRKIIEKSLKIAYANRHKYVGSEHLLAAILQLGDKEIKKILDDCSISEQSLIYQIDNLLKSASKLSEITDNFKESHKFDLPGQVDEEEDGRGMLDFFGKNLCSAEAQKKIDPVIGRNSEIERIIEVLCRRTKNNPLLLGEPGVGKTAIIEGLAKKIVAGDVPPPLFGKKIYSLDMPSLIAGTTYRGEFESRIRQLIDELAERPEIILFIDELHTIVGAGSASGSMDAANMLKPALARGEIRCIGATTYSDFRKSIENDPALERRFQTIKVEEPDEAEAKKIIFGIKEYFENFHKVRITDEAIEAAVELSQRYQPEKFLPDKAIDLIDEASAAAKIRQGQPKDEKEMQSVLASLKELETDLKDSIFADKIESAEKIKNEIEKIKAQIQKLKIKIDKKKNRLKGKVSGGDVAKIISKQAGIPLSNLEMSENKRISSLDERIKKEIIGQDDAIGQLSKHLKRSKAGLSSNNKPLGSFLFVGPSGVGKTYAAKILAREFFGDEKSLIRIDMSEYGEKFNVSKLIGAPAGYVGYKESGQLTERIRHRPHSLILLDEVEKANGEIFDLLLQVFEDGCLTDAAGRKINFRNSIIIMTSNLGSAFTQNKKDIGFGSSSDKNEQEKRVRQAASNWFRPELLSRLDKIIFFQPLDEATLAKIARKELEELSRRLLDSKKIKLSYSSDVIRAILVLAEQMKESEGLNQGARSIKKVLQEKIEPLLSEKILSTKNLPSKPIQLRSKNGIIKAS